MGKIAVLSGVSQSGTLTIESWVLSCRAFSRRIEHRCIDFLFEKFGVDEIVLEYEATPKNALIQEFISQFGDQLRGTGSSKQVRISRKAFKERCPPMYHQIKEIAVA